MFEKFSIVFAPVENIAAKKEFVIGSRDAEALHFAFHFLPFSESCCIFTKLNTFPGAASVFRMGLKTKPEYAGEMKVIAEMVVISALLV